MCIFCGDPDPLHGMGPAPLMLAAAGAMQVYTKVVRPLRRKGTEPSDGQTLGLISAGVPEQLDGRGQQPAEASLAGR
jgi:hypothetical protein